LTATNKDKPALLALCTVLDDDTTTAYRLEDLAPYKKGYPFRERMAIKLVRPLIEKQYAASAPKTIGDLAHDALKKATGKEWGRDAAAWRNWVEARKS